MFPNISCVSLPAAKDLPCTLTCSTDFNNKYGSSVFLNNFSIDQEDMWHHNPADHNMVNL